MAPPTCFSQRRRCHAVSLTKGKRRSDPFAGPASELIRRRRVRGGRCREYAQKWPTILYELRPGSIAVEPVGSNPSTYRVQFEYDFLVSNGSKEIDGVGKSDSCLICRGLARGSRAKMGKLARKTTRKALLSQFVLYVDKGSLGGDYREVDGVC